MLCAPLFAIKALITRVEDRYLTLLAVAASCLVFLAGCGGGGDTASAGASKAAYLKKVNSICRQGGVEFEKKAAAVFREAGSKPELEMRRDLVKTAIAPMFIGEIRAIAELEPPAGGAPQIDAIVAAMRRLVADLERDPLSRGQYPYRGVEDLAAGYGLPECGHP